MNRHSRDQWLLVRAGAQLCALPLEQVNETMRPQPVRPVSGAPHFVRGVAVLRGLPVPVIDAASMIGQTESTSRGSRFVALKTADRRVALAVDEVIGVRRIDEGALSDLPRLLAAASEQVVSAIGTLDAELLMVLESGKLVPETVWAAIEAERHR
ncbi:MAG: chemotaxis protein CheW [Vicinamibacterales bacterium]